MKVVINVCYGGFGVSTAALIELIKMKSELVKIVPIEKFSGCKNLQEYRKKNPYRVRNCNIKVRGFERDNSPDVLFKKDMVYTPKDGRFLSFRSHNDLIEIVEKLGKKSWGEFAELKIIEVPDDVDWIVDEYDGRETVEEVHRSWN